MTIVMTIVQFIGLTLFITVMLMLIMVLLLVIAGKWDWFKRLYKEAIEEIINNK